MRFQLQFESLTVEMSFDNLINYIKPLSASVALIIETSQLICWANQLTGFYMRATLALNGLKEKCIYYVYHKVINFLRSVNSDKNYSGSTGFQ